VSNIELEEINNLNSFSVCLVQGRPTIRVASLDTDERWLFDTGAGVSVIHKDLYNRMNPKPKLSESPYSVTGANKKPVDLLGVAKRLPIKLLNEETTVDVLVSPELSYQAILGMDVIRKLNIVLNPRTLKFSKIKDVPVSALALQTYRVPPMCGRPIKIKVNGPLCATSNSFTTTNKPSMLRH
jgi:predicted aspartyl protease